MSELIDVLHEEIVRAVGRVGINDRVAADIACSVEAAVRRRVGGDRYHIARHNRAERADLIMAELQAGEHPTHIAARHAVSRRWVQMLRKRLQDAARTIAVESSPAD